MSKPLVVTLPHQVGKEEVIRRIKAGTDAFKRDYGHWITLEEERWNGDQLAFQISALAQRVSGTIDVAEDSCTLSMTLPWVLQIMAEKFQGLIQKEGTALLENKKK